MGYTYLCSLTLKTWAPTTPNFYVGAGGLNLGPKLHSKLFIHRTTSQVPCPFFDTKAEKHYSKPNNVMRLCMHEIKPSVGLGILRSKPWAFLHREMLWDKAESLNMSLSSLCLSSLINHFHIQGGGSHG